MYTPTDNNSITGLHYSTITVTPKYEGDYKSIATQYRKSGSSIHPSLQYKIDIMRGMNNGNEIDINILMINIKNLLCIDFTKNMIFQLMYDALFMADRARHYQLNIRHMDKWPPHTQKIYPQHCIMHDHSNINNSCHHELFECESSKKIWEYTNNLLQSMGLPIQVQSVEHLLLILHNHGSDFSTSNIVNINLIIQTIKVIWDTYKERMEKYKFGNGISGMQLKEFNNKTLTNKYKRMVVDEMRLLPNHMNTIKMNNLNKTKNAYIPERSKILINEFKVNFKKLPDNHFELYKDTYLLTGLIDVKINANNTRHIEFIPPNVIL